MNYSHRKIGSRLHIFAPRQIRGSHPIVARGCWPLIMWKSDAPLPSFPHRSCKTVQWGPIPLLQARCIPIEPGYDPAWQSPRAISQSDAFRSISPAYQRQAAATPAGNGLFICLILFCSQYVMNSYTQYTLNKVCIGLFVFIPQRSEVNPELPRT